MSFIELALDFEEYAARTLPAAPQAKFQGHTLPLQERARVLRLALCTLQRLVKSGSLHPAKVITRATSLVPLGGPLVAGLNRRAYFACRDAMHKHIQLLASYCESTWTLRTHTQTHAHRPYETVRVSSWKNGARSRGGAPATCTYGRLEHWAYALIFPLRQGGEGRAQKILRGIFTR